MSEIRLEVGKRYFDRIGQLIRITGHNPEMLYAFYGEYEDGESETFMVDGRCDHASSPFDIIREVTP